MKIKTTCQYCKKQIEVKIPKKILHHLNEENLGCSCNECIPNDSAARNNIEESIFIEEI